jgi:predicted methyltransferase
MKQETVQGSLIAIAHEVVAAVVNPGDVVVDATVGNGHDTLFLANCVGGDGRVIGFDLQRDAIESARTRMSEAGVCEDNYELHVLGHELMAAYVPMGVAAVMFNLGYLPGGDKGVITQVATTLDALDAALACLRSGGELSVMCYPGHPGGDTEAEAVVKWLDGVLLKTCESTCYQRIGASETTPFLLVVKKQ